MMAFAANSILTRQALTTPAIDPASYSAVRVASGALMLAMLVQLRHGALDIRSAEWRTLDWRATLALFGYAVLFSYAYLTLAAGTGALILFGAVQIMMFGWAIHAGERLGALAWLGLGLAFAGLIWLVLPGLTAPDPFGAAMMAGAGIAWGLYSLRGRGARDPLGVTAINFIAVAPLMCVVGLIAYALGHDIHASLEGVLLAVASGALASGCGYAIWYAALSGLRAGQASTIQLSVPVIAALGGVILLSEPLTTRLVIASLMVLGGVFIALRQKGS